MTLALGINNAQNTTVKHKLINRPHDRKELRNLDLNAEGWTVMHDEFASITIQVDERERPKLPGCSGKNRFGWPINATRVHIQDEERQLQPTTSNSLGQGMSRRYINANYITDNESRRMFIASEAPLESTIIDFWAMVFQERSPAIVMLTKLTEQHRTQEKEMSVKYFPEDEATYGPFLVRLLHYEEAFNCEIREFVIEKDGEKHVFRHYWFKNWDDQAIPGKGCTKWLVRIAADVEIYRNEHRRTYSQTGPIIVHCCAGRGRSCTFIAIILAAQQLFQSGVVDIAYVVSKLRTQRLNAIDRACHYAYIYNALQYIDKILPNYECGTDFPSEAFIKVMDAIEEANAKTDEPVTGSSSIANNFFF
uniref:protein-tyrosine-phosphatase n=1 Tax=Syphacia muris TaxID=451379 RepID=A0A0N5AJP4_9BILA